MKINKEHGSYNITRRTSSIKYIVCHYTGSGTSKAGSAKANCQYFGRANRRASAHYFIDDSGIWEYADPDTWYTWHCGDGHGKYGITNGNSIGIEVCMDGDNPYTETEIGYLGELVRYLMDRYDVPASRVVRHYDASRKMCPYYYAKRQSEWVELRDRITSGKAPSAPSGSSGSSTSSDTLAVDGKVGPATVKAWQRIMGTTVDGVIGGQSSASKKCHSAINAIRYTTFKRGSQLICAVQRKLGCKVDGLLGPQTIKAIQKHLGVEQDGHFGPATAKALQRRLNTGKF